MIKSKYKSAIIKVIRKYLPDCNIYLFGSRATGKAKEYSDIDIALDNFSVIDRRFLRKITDELEDTNIPLEIDVVDIYVSSDDLRAKIKKEGILWND